jgi:hypothetical protein
MTAAGIIGVALFYSLSWNTARTFDALAPRVDLVVNGPRTKARVF